MRARIIAFNLSLNSYQAKTENNISLSFGIPGADHLKLDDVLEVDLPNFVATQRVTRVSDGRAVQIKMGLTICTISTCRCAMAQAEAQAMSALRAGLNPSIERWA